MKNFVKYIGNLIVVIGVLILAVPKFMGTGSNTLLLSGLLTISIGIIVYIFINRNYK